MLKLFSCIQHASIPAPATMTASLHSGKLQMKLYGDRNLDTRLHKLCTFITSSHWIYTYILIKFYVPTYMFWYLCYTFILYLYNTYTFVYWYIPIVSGSIILIDKASSLLKYAKPFFTLHNNAVTSKSVASSELVGYNAGRTVVGIECIKQQQHFTEKVISLLVQSLCREHNIFRVEQVLTLAFLYFTVLIDAWLCLFQ